MMLRRPTPAAAACAAHIPVVVAFASLPRQTRDELALDTLRGVIALESDPGVRRQLEHALQLAERAAR